MSHFDLDTPKTPEAAAPLLTPEEPSTAVPNPNSKLIRLPLLGYVSRWQLGLMGAGLAGIVLFAALRGAPAHPAPSTAFATQPVPAPSEPPEALPATSPTPDAPEAPPGVDVPVMPPDSLPASRPDTGPTEAEVNALSQSLATQQRSSEKNREDIDALTRRLDGLALSRPTVGPAPAAVRHVTTHKTATRHRTTTSPHTALRRATQAGRPYQERRQYQEENLHQASIVSLYPGLAWVKYQGSTWALRPGDRLDTATVMQIDTQRRAVITSTGTIR